MNSTLLRKLIFVLALTFIGVACSDSSTSPDSDPATVEGQVENTSSDSESAKYKSIEGAVVTAAQVTSSGELEALGTAEAETDADGEFTLEIDSEVAANTANSIVIVAESNGQTAKTFVTGQLESGSRVEVQPITYESSAETEVYQRVVANGDIEIVHKADIEATVNSEVAQDIESNSQQAANVAAALAARAEAKAQYYSDLGIELTEEQMNNISETKTEAQVKLESSLNSATNAEQKQAAFDAFLETVAQAETEAEVQATGVAKVSESSSRVMVNNSSDLSVEAQAEIRKHVAYMTAFVLESAVEAQMEAMAATESSINSAVDASATLRTEVKEMGNASQEEVQAAFETFNAEIISILESDAEVNGDLFVSANTIINQNGGAKATLESSLEATAKLSLILDAYTQFYSQVGTVVDSTFSNASEAEAEAYTQLFILINMAS